MECPQPHTILAAVDESENSRRAVNYLSRWVACYEEAEVVLTHVVKEPSEDVLPDQDEREVYLAERREAGQALLTKCRERLERHGVPSERLAHNLLTCVPPDTIVEAILQEMENGDYDTIVLGRRGMSKKEEYIFGSVTNRLVREIEDSSVWVVP